MLYYGRCLIHRIVYKKKKSYLLFVQDHMTLFGGHPKSLTIFDPFGRASLLPLGHFQPPKLFTHIAAIANKDRFIARPLITTNNLLGVTIPPKHSRANIMSQFVCLYLCHVLLVFNVFPLCSIQFREFFFWNSNLQKVKKSGN
jgi:hypothetical protein